MKKKIIFIFSLSIIILLSFIIYKLVNNKNIRGIYNSLVYIQAIDEDTITSGSGFVYKVSEAKNYIVTNYHVIENYSNIYVYNINKDRVKANLLNYNEDNDIAILVIEDKLGLKAANFGDNKKIKHGDKAFVVGTPMDIKNIGTINEGIINDIVQMDDLGFDFDPIEVSAKTNFGNSGGPLLNRKGQVIGMMFLKDKTIDDISFAIPINFVLETITKLENRVSLGAVMTNTTNESLLDKYNIDVSDIKGVVILEINKSGVLEKYKLKKGDIIISFNDSDINNVNELREQLYEHNIGDIVYIGYYRDGKYYKISIQL